MAKSLLTTLDKEQYVTNMIQFSAQTSANHTQSLIDGRLERRRRGIFGPHINKRMVIFVDDLNMPMLEEYGAQPPIELLRSVDGPPRVVQSHKENVDFREIEKFSS